MKENNPSIGGPLDPRELFTLVFNNTETPNDPLVDFATEILRVAIIAKEIPNRLLSIRGGTILKHLALMEETVRKEQQEIEATLDTAIKEKL